jgi:hydrogenase maturation protease
MLSALIFGIGNSLRRDDGFGWRVVEALAPSDGVETVTCIQLTPEYTDLVRLSRRVLFVDLDQRLTPGVSRFVFVRPVQARPGALVHHLEPAELLGLTRTFFGVVPGAAWLAGAGGQDLELGEGLSAAVEPAVARVVGQIQRALARWIQLDAALVRGDRM